MEVNVLMDTLSDELLIEAYNNAKTYNLDLDFIRLLEGEILQRIVIKMILDSRTEDIAELQSLSIDSNAVNEYFNLV